jgi:hypothetical protein
MMHDEVKEMWQEASVLYSELNVCLYKDVLIRFRIDCLEPRMEGSGQVDIRVTPAREGPCSGIVLTYPERGLSLSQANSDMVPQITGKLSTFFPHSRRFISDVINSYYNSR